MKSLLLAVFCLAVPLYLWAQTSPATGSAPVAPSTPAGQKAITTEPTTQKKAAPSQGEQPLQSTKPTAQTQQQPKKVKPFPYSAQMMRAQRDQGWSRSYMASFKRSKEGRYLQLAGRHITNAITTYYNIQQKVSKKSRFHYKARSKRLVACSYHKLLKSSDRGRVSYIQPLSKHLCKDN